MQQDIPKPRPKQLPQSQLQKLKLQPQYLPLTSTQFILYNLVQKQSNSGLFKNERLLLLNTKQQTISYLSKIPAQFIPFYSEEEIYSQIAKEKLGVGDVYENGVNKCSCRKIMDKNGVEIKLFRNDRKVQWIYYYASRELMEEWFDHISFMFTRSREEVDQRYHNIQPIKEDQKPQDPISPYNDKQQSLHPKQEYKQQSPQNQKQLIKSHQNKDFIGADPQQVDQIKRNEQKQSQFQDFSENTPLGQFVRMQRYNTAQQKKRAGSIYSNSPPKSEKLQRSNIKKQEQQSRLRQMEQRNYDKGYSSKHQQRIKDKQLYESINQKIESDHRLIIRNDKAQLSNSFAKSSPSKTIDWTLLYHQQQDSKSTVYFKFVEQSINFAKQMVARLPITKQLYSLEKIGGYYHHQYNGIFYKIAYSQEGMSLIYELSQSKPIVRDNYQFYQQLGEQFYQQKRVFFEKRGGKPLICLIQLKGLLFYCRSNAHIERSQNKRLQFKRSNVNEDYLLRKIDNLQIYLTSSADFIDIMRQLNTYSLNWGYLYHRTTIRSYKIIFLNEIFSDIFINILRGQLCHVYSSAVFDKFNSLKRQTVQQILNDSMLLLVNRLLGKGKQTDQIWDIILDQTLRQYQIDTTKEYVQVGYLLYSVILKIGIKLQKGIKMKEKCVLFKKDKAITKEIIEEIQPKLLCLNYQQMSPVYRQIKQTLQNDQQNIEQLQLLINTQDYLKIPPLINYFTPKIHLLISKTIPYQPQEPIYQSLLGDSPSQNNYQLALSAISWYLQARQVGKAHQLAFVKIESLIFWAGKVPIISLFYQNFAQYYLMNDQSDKSIEQQRLSLRTLSEILGPTNSKLLQRRMNLSDKFLALGRKQQALKQLSQAKLICESDKKQQSSLKSILSKIAKITLSLGKYNESIQCSMACLKKLQVKAEDQNIFKSEDAVWQFLQIGQLLLRGFQLSNRKKELFQIAALCSERCLKVGNERIYKKLFKIILFPYLKRLAFKESQLYLFIVQELNSYYRRSSMNQTHLLHWINQRQLLSNFTERNLNYFKNLTKLCEQIIKHRLLQQYHFEDDDFFLLQYDKNDIDEFLKQTFLITNLIGIGYIQGILKDFYYE